MLLVAFRAGDLYLSSDISSFSGRSYSYCYPASIYVTMKNENTCKAAQMRCVVISHWIWGQKLANLLVLSTSGSPARQTRRPLRCLHLLVTDGNCTTRQRQNRPLQSVKLAFICDENGATLNRVDILMSISDLIFTDALSLILQTPWSFVFLYKLIWHNHNPLLSYVEHIVILIYMDVFLDGDVGQLSVRKKHTDLLPNPSKHQKR